MFKGKLKTHFNSYFPQPYINIYCYYYYFYYRVTLQTCIVHIIFFYCYIILIEHWSSIWSLKITFYDTGAWWHQSYGKVCELFLYFDFGEQGWKFTETLTFYIQLIVMAMALLIRFFKVYHKYCSENSEHHLFRFYMTIVLFTKNRNRYEILKTCLLISVSNANPLDTGVCQRPYGMTNCLPHIPRKHFFKNFQKFRSERTFAKII